LSDRQKVSSRLISPGLSSLETLIYASGSAAGPAAARRDELRDSRTAVDAPSKEVVRSAEEAVREAMLHGTPGQRKALLKELIVEVRVESRDSIIPTFRLPSTPVRVTETMVDHAARE
jgi:hypothetical protein